MNLTAGQKMLPYGGFPTPLILDTGHSSFARRDPGAFEFDSNRYGAGRRQRVFSFYGTEKTELYGAKKKLMLMTEQFIGTYVDVYA